jgi:hypothetical protein
MGRSGWLGPGPRPGSCLLRPSAGSLPCAVTGCIGVPPRTSGQGLCQGMTYCPVRRPYPLRPSPSQLPGKLAGRGWRRWATTGGRGSTAIRGWSTRAWLGTADVSTGSATLKRGPSSQLHATAACRRSGGTASAAGARTTIPGPFKDEDRLDLELHALPDRRGLGRLIVRLRTDYHPRLLAPLVRLGLEPAHAVVGRRSCSAS